VGERAFGHSAESVGAFNFIALFCDRRKLPARISGQRVHVNAAFKEVARRLRQLRQGVLQSVVNLTQKTRPQFDRQHIPRKFHSIANGNTFGDLENLKLANLAANPDYFTFKPFIGDLYIADLVHGNISVKTDAYHIAVYGRYRSFCSDHLGSPRDL